MAAQHLKQWGQAFLESSRKIFFSSKSSTLTENQKRLCEELDDAVGGLNSTIDEPYVDSSDYSGTEKLQRFLKENQDNKDLRFVLNLKKGEFASTVLHDVASYNREAVGLLLQAGADPSIQNKEGKTPLQIAIDNNCYTAVGLFFDEELQRLPDKQKELNEELLNLISEIEYVSEREKFDLEYRVNYDSIAALKKFLDRNEKENNEDLKAVLNLRRGEYGSTILHDMNNFFYDKTLNILLKAGADPNIQDVDGKTPLHRAAEYNCIEITKSLLDSKKVDINIQDREGKTPLYHTSEQSYEDLTDVLLERGAKVDIQDNEGNTPLLNAAKRGDKNIVGLLAKKTCDINCQNSLQETALHLALWYSRESAVADFILGKYKEDGKDCKVNNNINVNIEDSLGRTPLLLAAEKSETFVLEQILKKGADAKHTDNEGNTALHYAARNSYTGENCKTTKYDIRSPDDDAFDLDNKEDYFETTASRNINLLLEKENGMDINARNKHGHTPLFFAVEYNKNETVELLLNKRADIDVVDESGFTIFHFAIKKRSLEILKTLLLNKTIEDKDGIPIKEFDQEKARKLLSVIDKEGNTLLHHAVKWGCSEEILKLIIKYGDVDINTKNNHGVAPIHIAAKYGSLSQIDFFIKKKADLNVQCDNLSSSLINGIGKEKELSGDATDTYINVQDGNLDPSSTVDIKDNVEHKKAPAILIATEGGHGSVVNTFLSAGAKPTIADSRNWLPLHIAIKRASEEGCTEEEREERLKIVRSLASVSYVESLMSQGIDKRSEIWKDQFFKEIKNSLTDALEVTDNEKIQKEVEKTFCDLLLQVTRNKEEISRILQGAVEARNGGKSPNAPLSEEPNAPVFDDNAYNVIGSHVKKPTLYPDLADDWMDAWDLQGDHSELQRQREVTAEEIEDGWGGWNLQADHSALQHQREVTAEEIEDGWGYIDDDKEKKDVNNGVSIWSSKELTKQEKTLLPNQARARESSFKLSLNQKTQLNKFLDLIYKAHNMTELYDVVSEALKAGVRINFAQDNNGTFTNQVISRTDCLSVEKEEDAKIAGKIIYELTSKGGHISDKVCIWNLGEVFNVHKEDLEKAKQEFDQYRNKFGEIAKSAINQGELNNLEIDNTTFYLEYSEDSSVDIAKIIDGAKGLGLNQGDIAFGGNVIKIGESEVEVELENDIRDYTDISGDITLTFHTSLGELEVRLHSDTQDIIKVEVCDRKKFNQLLSANEEIGKNCLLGGYYVCDAIEQGYFKRPSSGKLRSSEIINLSENIMEKANEIVKSLNPSDITVNSSVNDVPLSKVNREKNSKIALGG